MGKIYPGDCTKFKNFEKAMNQLERLGPAILIEGLKGEGRGIAIRLGENLSKKWQSGDVIIFWSNGDHTTMDPEDEIRIINADLFCTD